MVKIEGKKVDMAKKPVRRILVFREQADDILVNFDVASSNEEKDRIANIIYETLFYYSLSNVVVKKNQSTYIVQGLAKEDCKKSVCEDIYDAYVDWYTNRQAAL